MQNRSRVILRAVLEGDLPPLPPKTGPADWYTALEDLIDDAPDSVIPPWETKRIDLMIKDGKIDPDLPIFTMGGSSVHKYAAARNSGGPIYALKATPKEVPRIRMPDGREKRVTPRMMARLMSLPDDFNIPEGHALAKTVLGNGIDGNITRKFIQPMVDRTRR